MLEPSEIIQTLKNDQDKQNQRKASVGLIKGIITDAKEFFTKLFDNITELKNSTFKVNVENQIELPETQKIEGEVSIKEIRSILLGLNEMIKGLYETKSAIEANKIELPEQKEVDFSSLEKAIREIPETVIPEYPEQKEEIRISNLNEITKYFQAVIEKIEGIKIPETKIPAFPKKIEISNLPEEKEEEKCTSFSWDVNENGDLTSITENYPSGQVVSTGWALGRVKIDDKRS